MPIEIRETTMTPDVMSTVIQLHISDVAPNDEDATFRLVLLAKLPAYQAPLIAHVQREAMKIAQAALTSLIDGLAQEIWTTKEGVEPRRIPVPVIHYGGSTKGPD